MGRCSVLYESGARDAVDTRWDIAGCICEDGWGVGSAWGGLEWERGCGTCFWEYVWGGYALS